MNTKLLKVVIIDDEEDIREILAETINDSLEMEVVGQADSLKSGYDLIINTMPDAIFLDIKIKGGDAFQLLKILKRNMEILPPIILNTGYDDFEYAQRSLNEFGDDIVMILKKPFWENWSEKEDLIINKINSKKQNLKINQNLIKIKIQNTTYFINLDNLICIESDYMNKGSGKVLLITKEKKFEIYKSLMQLEEELPPNFIRVSRTTIVNKNFISSYDHFEQVLYLREIDHSSIGVGNAYKKDLLKLLE